MIVAMDKFLKDKQKEYDKDRIQVMKTVPFDRLFKWMEDSYTEQLPKLQWPTDYSKGAMKRLFNISTMKYNILPNLAFGNVIVFKLYDINLRKEINYASIFCESIDEIKEENRSVLDPSQILGTIVMQYYSVSSSFISCDGEYRSRFSRYENYIETKIKFPEIWNEIDAYIHTMSMKRNWSIYATYFHGKELGETFELERIVKSDLIAQSMLALTWFHTIYNEYLSITESHINAAFREIMLANSKVDLEFMKELIKKYGESDVEKFRIGTSYVVHPILGTDTVRYVPIGYKMIPLNLREIQEPMRIKYKPWREYLIANKCNDLIINQIAPGFPVTIDWFIIKKSHKGLFDNKSQYERLKNSELAKSVLALLNEAQRSTYFATSELGNTNKATAHIKQFISSKFRRLSDKIKDPINYSTEEIIMSDVTLAYPSEYVGRTFADTIDLVRRSKTYDDKIGGPFRTHPDMFAKYMFEICYNLLALNTKLHSVHGDFHLNNATIGYLYASTPDAKVAYQLNVEHTYLFPNNGYFACIIDFSRAMIDVEHYNDLRDISMPAGFAPVDDYDSFESNEINNLLYWYLQLFPSKQKQRDHIAGVFKQKFSSVFKLLTCMDLFMFVIRLNTSLKQQEYQLHKKSIDLLENLAKLSEKYIATEMNNLISDESYSVQHEFPIATIIKKCFSEYLDGAAYKSIGVVTDMYTLENNIVKSLSKYDTFPDALKYSRYYDTNGKIVDVEKINKVRALIRDSYERKRLFGLEHVRKLSQF